MAKEEILMMTEDEAAKKKCHVTFTRAGSIGERGQEETCMASGCMAWRWARELKVFEADPGLSAEVITDKGYCGLAGQP